MAQNCVIQDRGWPSCTARLHISTGDATCLQFGRPRRSELSVDSSDAIDEMAVIPNEPAFLVSSRRGYIKRMRADTFTLQARNGRGECRSHR